MGEIIFLSILGGVGVSYFIEIMGYTVSRFEKTGGPAVYPKLILICLFIFLGIRIIQIILNKEQRGQKFVFLNLFRGRKGIFFLSFVLYIILMPFLGYIIATFIFFIFSSMYLSYLKEGSFGTKKRFLIRIAYFGLITFCIYGFFVRVLNVSVPSGFLENLL